MKKRKITMEEALKKAEPILRKHSDEANEMVLDVGKRIIEDQMKWLDDQMRDLLPPNLYAMGLAGECETLIGNYLADHKIRIVFVPDRLVIRIMLGDKVHSQFVPELQCDGEKVGWETVNSPFSPEKN